MSQLDVYWPGICWFWGDSLREKGFICMFLQFPNRLGTKPCMLLQTFSQAHCSPGTWQFGRPCAGAPLLSSASSGVVARAFGAVEGRLQQVPLQPSPADVRAGPLSWNQPHFCYVEPISTPPLPMFQNPLESWARGDVLLVCSSWGSNQVLYVQQQISCSD